MESVMFEHLIEKINIMFNIKSVTIPTPCHQSWQQMEQNEQGRHCQQCSKTVVDFSKMTADEILAHLNNSANVCGRFGEFQLTGINSRLDNKDLAGKNYSKKWLVAAGLLGTSFLNKASAQTMPPKAVVTQQNQLVTPIGETPIMGKIAMNTPFTINGHIVAKDDLLPIPGAPVRIKGTNIGVVTDKNGDFSLTTFSPTTTLVVGYIGYQSQEITVNNVSAKPVSVALTLSTSVMGEIVIVKRPLFTRVYNRFIRYPIKKLFTRPR
jgi:hypothetical protein